MRVRGQVFWEWANPLLHSRSSEFRLQDRGTANVQVRTSSAGSIQLFIGIYCPNGAMLFEESFDTRPGQTMTQASAWGMEKAKVWLESHAAELSSVGKTNMLLKK
ncbi:hypothetical protein [Pseudomonas syringae group genomosp. 3]|uniref:hypothetical protein n=1 Tax=Pseudomonas syringae group genomosp. 3 TaxID=251701 RepID=UPI000CF01EC1|nr:hypothetical protein [Pseudomonas syringae group genomosp. 3]